jgi:hypothetical protein
MFCTSTLRLRRMSPSPHIERTSSSLQRTAARAQSRPSTATVDGGSVARSGLICSGMIATIAAHAALDAATIQAIGGWKTTDGGALHARG